MPFIEVIHEGDCCHLRLSSIVHWKGRQPLEDFTSDNSLEQGREEKIQY